MNEEKYRILVENATEGIVVVQEGRISFFNDEALKLLKCSAEEITSKPFGDFIYTGDRSLALKRHHKRINGDEVDSNYQVRLIDMEGHTIWAHVKSVLITWEGHPAGMHLVRDITDLKQAEDELRKSFEFSTTILNSTNDAISVINVRDYTIAAANTVFLKQLGLKEKEVIGKTCYELTHRRTDPCKGPDDICPLTNTLSGGVHAVVEHIHRTVDGQKIYVEVSTSPIRDNKGEITQVVHVSRDITERKQAENAIRESEASLAEAQRVAHLGNWDWDIVNSKLHWSDELFRIFGLEPQEIDPYLGKFLSFVHPEDREAAKESFNKALSNRKGYTMEYRIIRPNGSERFVNDKTEIITDKDDRPIHVRGTVYDITRLKKVEQALRESEAIYSSLFEHSPNPLWDADWSAVKVYIDNLRVSGVEDLREYFDQHQEELIHCLSLIKLKKSNQAAIKTTLLNHKITISDDLRSLINSDQGTFFSPETIASFREIIVKIIEGGPVVEREISTRSLEGTFRHRIYKSSVAPGSEETLQRIFITATDITERRKAEEEREQLILQLQDAAVQIKTLSGLVPICATCKKIRDDKGYWNGIETYIEAHSDAEFSHGICPECMEKLYPDLLNTEK